MQPRIWVNKAKFNDNTVLSLDENHILVFVGSNNVGKTACLRDFEALLQNVNSNSKIVNYLEISTSGTEDELIAFLEANSKNTSRSSNSDPVYAGQSYSVSRANSLTWWSEHRKGISGLISVFVRMLQTTERLGLVSPAQNISVTQVPPSHPIHELYRDRDLEIRLSKLFHRAFGMDLMVHRHAGSIVPLHVGKRLEPKPGTDSSSLEAIAELESNSLLHEQGDGIMSFAGILLESLTRNTSVLILDEPEAFLHPPQARLLGSMLATELGPNKQWIVATHSLDFLLGLLESSRSNVSIVRIEREELTNSIKVLDNDGIRNIWKDSLLRYSRILEGLFHQEVVICEGDADCRFYEAVLDSIQKAGEPRPDVLFIHCGGKDRIPMAASALVGLGVPSKIVVDFDVLSKEDFIQKLVGLLGGDWQKLRADWQIVHDSISKQLSSTRTKDFADEINRIITENATDEVSRETCKRIGSYTDKQKSPWSLAKRIGKDALPPGRPRERFESLQRKLSRLGLFILDVGQLESFDKSIKWHGPKWTSEALGKDLKNDPTFAIARKFVRKLSRHRL